MKCETQLFRRSEPVRFLYPSSKNCLNCYRITVHLYHLVEIIQLWTLFWKQRREHKVQWTLLHANQITNIDFERRKFASRCENTTFTWRFFVFCSIAAIDVTHRIKTGNNMGKLFDMANNNASLISLTQLARVTELISGAVCVCELTNAKNKKRKWERAHTKKAKQCRNLSVGTIF